MRVAALCAEPERARRGQGASSIAPPALERELWSGESPSPAARAAAEVVAHVEELARAILKDAACGHLGADLRATADEILLADGLAVGEGVREQRGGTAEWDSEVDGAEYEWAGDEEAAPDRRDPRRGPRRG